MDMYIKVNKVQFCKIMVFVIFLCKSMLSGYVTQNTNLLTTISVFFTIFILTGIVYVTLKNRHAIPLDYICLVGFVLCSYYMTIHAFPIYKEYIKNEFWGPVLSLYQGIAGYFFVRFVDSEELIWSAVKIASYVLFLFYFAQSINTVLQGYWLIEYHGKIIISQYNMSFGYNMLLPTLIFLYRGLNEKKSSYIIIAAIGCIEILMLGSRGALIGIPALFLLYVLFGERNKKNKIISIVAIILISIVFFFLYVPILKFIADIFEFLGFSSRNILRILEGTFTSTSSREYLYSKTIGMIKQNPMGNGILSDRYYVGQYCHNIFLEIFMDYGVILGGFFIIVLLVLYIKAFRVKHDKWKALFIIFFCTSFFRLLVSYSFWLDPFFWVTIAIAISTSRQKCNFKKVYF